MMDDLVKRLREEAIMLSGIGINRGSVDASLDALLADEAAAALEAKDAELARMNEQMTQLGALVVSLQSNAEELHDQLQQLLADLQNRAALQAKE